MEITTKATDEKHELTLNGSFTFSDNQIFRNILRDIEALRKPHVFIDLHNVDFIDSAALGMLLLLRDTCEQSGSRLVLHNPSGQVAKMFALSKFDTLFSIK